MQDQGGEANAVLVAPHRCCVACHDVGTLAAPLYGLCQRANVCLRPIEWQAPACRRRHGRKNRRALRPFFICVPAIVTPPLILLPTGERGRHSGCARLVVQGPLGARSTCPASRWYRPAPRHCLRGEPPGALNHTDCKPARSTFANFSRIQLHLFCWCLALPHCTAYDLQIRC